MSLYTSTAILFLGIFLMLKSITFYVSWKIGCFSSVPITSAFKSNNDHEAKPKMSTFTYCGFKKIIKQTLNYIITMPFKSRISGQHFSRKKTFLTNDLQGKHCVAYP
uniref:Uncharacterized protein n=1 Tax=Anguilla anguilla TaxID=7936 RepID=A0A0E9XP75_ANGAN